MTSSAKEKLLEISDAHESGQLLSHGQKTLLIQILQQQSTEKEQEMTLPMLPNYLNKTAVSEN